MGDRTAAGTRPDTDRADRTAGGDRQDDPVAGLSVAEAARALGLSTDAVRAKLRRGTLDGHKGAGGEWVVRLPGSTPSPVGVDDRQAARQDATAGRQDAPTGRQDTDRTATAGELMAPGASNPGVDLAPLAELIGRLHDENARLTEAAAVWQVRAVRAEERLQAIEAGAVAGPQDAPVAAPAAPGAAEGAKVAGDAPAPWWRFWGRGRGA